MTKSDVKPNILIVEDVSADLDLLNHLLHEMCTIYVAKSGESALQKARNLKPDLILLDIILPDQSGFEILTTLRNSNETRDIPVIVITALNNAMYEEKGLTLGAIDYITKPFHGMVVRTRIGMHLQIIQHIRTIKKLGLTDTVTGLSSPRYFDEQIEMEWARAIREQTAISLLTICLDPSHLSSGVVDIAWEEVLMQKTAKAISETLRRPADFAARTQENQFSVILPNTGKTGAMILANSIRLKLNNLFAMPVKIGLASAMPSREDSFDGFLENAKIESVEKDGIAENNA